MKITFCCIVFNGDYVLDQLIDSIYPFAHKIIFVDGVVDYWAQKGFKGSTDRTRKIINEHPDPVNKIVLLSNRVATEKTELCQMFMEHVPSDTDYIWCQDSDEIFTSDGYKSVFQVCETRRPHSIGFQSNTFFGGFDHILDGFERDHNFKRVLKYESGCTYLDHRPPTLSCEKVPDPLHISGKEMADKYGVEMFHYSYVWPSQVKSKIEYYKAVISRDNCIDNYFFAVWLKWVLGDDLQKDQVEHSYNGVHEFIPSYRQRCGTMPFTGQHPYVIQRSLPELTARLHAELRPYKEPDPEPVTEKPVTP